MTVQSKLDLCIMGNKEVQVGGGGDIQEVNSTGSTFKWFSVLGWDVLFELWYIEHAYLKSIFLY